MKSARFTYEVVKSTGFKKIIRDIEPHSSEYVYECTDAYEEYHKMT